MSYSNLFFIQLNQVTGPQNLFPEVPVVEYTIKDHFIECLKLSDRKFLRQKIKADGLIPQCFLKMVQSFVNNFRMVECQGGIFWMSIQRALFLIANSIFLSGIFISAKYAAVTTR